MASRLMHVCIGEMVCSKLKLDRNRFLLGTIAPDAYYNRKFKRFSHFFLDAPDEERFIDTGAFLSKYEDSLEDDFFLGYYCHLLSDNLFYASIFSKYVKPYGDEEQKRIIKICYHDLSILNSILVKEYDMKNDFTYFDDFSLEEVDMNNFGILVGYLMKDYDMTNISSIDQLQIYNYDEIIEYLNKSGSICTEKIESILTNRGSDGKGWIYDYIQRNRQNVF